MGDDDNEARKRERQQRRVMTPANEVPVSLPWSAVLARTDDTAVLLLGAQLYTTGIQFELSVRGRGSAMLDLHSAAAGRPDARGDMLCLGVAGLDGFAGTNAHRGRRTVDDGPTLTAGGGGGSHGTVSTSYLLHPAPPPGVVTLWCAWPARGIPETAVEFDGSSLGDLVGEVEVLWPEDTSWPPRLPEPNLPAGGWFAEHAQTTA